MASTITRTAMTDDDGTGTTGTVFNNAWKTSVYDQIDALFSGTLALGTGIVAGTLVSTWGNKIAYDGSNQLFIGIPGTGSSAKRATFVDSGGSVAAFIDSQGMGIFNGAVRSTHATTPSGYSAGAGGAQTQATSKATGVTLNKVTGQITLNNAALGAGAYVSFVVTNSAVAAVDTIRVCVASGGTANAYIASVTAVAAGSFTITVQNITGGSLSEAPVINFTVFKGQTS